MTARLLGVYANIGWAAEKLHKVKSETESDTSEGSVTGFELASGALAAIQHEGQKQVVDFLIYEDSQIQETLIIFITEQVVEWMKKDKRIGPNEVSLYDMARIITKYMISKWVMDCNITPRHDSALMDIVGLQMTWKAYRGTWRQYEEKAADLLDRWLTSADAAIATYKRKASRAAA